MIISILSWR